MSTQFRPEQTDLTKYWDFGSGTMRVPAGTSFPAGPGDGDTYYRTDEDLLYIYDGAEWERIQNHAVDVAIEQVGSPTYEDVQDWINTTQSAGLISGGAGTATSYAIATADDVAETFTISGDVTAYFTNGIVFTVSGSTGNDGDYTTVGNSTFGGGVTTITVADVPDGTNDGNIADGRVDVALGAGMVKKTDDAIDGVTAFFDWPATANILLVDNKVNWVYATYGGGTPAVAATDDHSTIDFTTEFVILVVYREGTVLHIMQAGLYIFDAFRSMARRVRELRRIERASGAIISDEGTLKMKVTAAVLYSVMTRLTTSEVDTSGAGRFRAWYHDGGGNWTSTGYPADQTDIDSANYDTGMGLAALAAARYGVYWVFLDFDSHLHVVYGVASYKLHEAESAELPAIPDICSEFAVLVARVIAFKDAAEITEVASAFVTPFMVATAANYADLANREHDVVGADHTLTGAQWVLVGATGVNTIGLLTPSDDVSGGAEAILKSTAAGDLTVHDLTATGQLSAGAGIAEGIILGADAQWYRSAANMLRTPDSVTIDIGLNVGTGTGAPAGGVYISNIFYSLRANATDHTFVGTVVGDTHARFVVYADGSYNWGSGAAVRDTNLYRDAANVLKTDDSLTVALGFNVGTTGAGTGEVRFSADLIGTGTQARFLSDTADASDTKYVGICGGGALSVIRGAQVVAYGNEYATAAAKGDLRLGAGHGDGGDNTGRIRIYTAGIERWHMDKVGNINPGGNKTQDFGLDGTAWDDVWGDDFQNEPDLYCMDDRKNRAGQIVGVDDLTVLRAMTSSGKYDTRTGLSLIDDASLPEWLFTRDKKTGETLYYPDGKPCGISVKMVTGLSWGAIRQLDGYRLVAAAEREAIREQIGILENQLALLNQAVQRGA